MHRITPPPHRLARPDGVAGDRRLRVVHIGDRDRRAQHRLAAVLVGDRGADLDRVGAAVERLDDRGVFLGDKAAADLARAGDLVVVGVEFLVEHEKTPDPDRIGQAGVAVADFVADQRAHLFPRREILERGIGQVLPLGPVADRGGVDRDDRRDKLPPVAEHHRLADIRAELELVLDELRSERGAVGELADIARPIDDDQMAAPVEIAGIAGPQPPVLGQRRAALLRLLVIAPEHAARAGQHLAVIGDP